MEEKIFQNRLIDSLSKFDKNTAIEYGSRRQTYAELDGGSNRIANRIIRNGIPMGTFLGILVGDRMDFIAAMIGILKAGCVFVPLDPAFPLHRLGEMIASTDIKCIITDRSSLERFSGGELSENRILEFLLLEDMLLKDGEPAAVVEKPAVPYTPEDKIYVYFTSGTTGKPKAIVGKNKSLLHFIDWEIETFGIDEGFRVSQFMAPVFDACLRDIFVPLLAGGVICIPENSDIMPAPDELAGWIDKSRVHLIHCVPSLFRLFGSGARESGQFKELKYILFSGERIDPSDLARWYDIFAERIQLVNMYGPTETTMVKTYYFIGKSDMEMERIPVGKPMKGARVIIFDKDMNLCDELTKGEIYIRTPYRTFGYYNAPELNRERFIPNPYNSNPDDLLYKTGDLGMLLPDGNLDLIGRIDRQVKLRGIRIELEGIERVLIKHPAVMEAAVIKKTVTDTNEFLCAYITSMAGDETEDLKEYLLRQLPDYMIPARIIKIDQFPRKPNGKIDYDALPDPLNDEKKTYTAPVTEVEEKLSTIWTEILGVEKISTDNHFLEMGGNSLTLVSLVSKIHKEFDVKIELRQVFEILTIKKQADFIASASREAYISIQPAEEKEYYAVSAAQNRLYFLERMMEGSVAYNMSNAVEMISALDKHRLEETFRDLIERHESLRTSFEMKDGTPIQKVHRHVEFEIEYYESAGKKENARNDIDLIVSGFIRPFDLSAAPLFRVGLIHVEGGRWVLMIDMHHIIGDGVSISILVRDFTALYSGEKLSPMKLQYRDYSEWQNRYRRPGLESGPAMPRGAYWLKQFEGEIPVIDLPLDYPRPAVQGFEGRTVSFQLDSETTGRLKRMALEENVTLFMLGLAAFNIFLSMISGQEDIVVGSPVAGRNHVDLEQIIGVFINTLAFRNYTDQGKTFREFLREVGARALDAFKNRDYPFEELVVRLSRRLERDTGRNPLFDVMFLFLNMAEPKTAGELPQGAYQFERRTTKFDLTLRGWEDRGRLCFDFQYSAVLFKAETIRRFVVYFERILSTASENPHIPLARMIIIPEEEKKRILYDFNDSTVSYPHNMTLDQLFEEQVDRNPDRIGVVGPSLRTMSGFPLQLSYGELNETAHRLSAVLRGKERRSGAVVGIMVEPSVEMIIGIMAILKSDGAYLPLDPATPKERIDFILKDSCVELVLNHADLTVLNPPCPRTQKNRRAQPDSLAYLIYTSGSTGQPKGVIIEHRSVVHILFSLQKEYPAGAADAILLKTSYVFDVSVTELLGWYMGGGRSAVLEKGGEKDPLAILNAVELHGISRINFVPSMFHAFIEHVNEGNRKRLASLRYIFLAGEALSPELVEKFIRMHTGIRLENLYGPTEGTVYASKYSLAAWEGTGTIPIGKPIGNLNLYILDTYDRIQPVGVTGELCIAGPGVARGYLNRPDLTAGTFVPSQFTTHPTRLYKTGDVARWLPDGNIEFFGRLDHQIKIRGFRVELGEIENRLLRHEKIKDASVTATCGGSLCAYIVPVSEAGDGNEDNGDSLPQQLKRYLANTLPDYMVPSIFVRLEEIPLTPNGKVDRKALPEPEQDSGDEYTAPRDLQEEKLVEIWAEILGMDESVIGVKDNFFQLGGHSVNLLMMLSRVYKEYGVHLPVTQLYREPTIEVVSKYITAGHFEDDNVVLLNSPAEKKLFCFPPGVGYGINYMGMASLLDDCAVYAFNFVEEEDRVSRIASDIINLQPEGPYRMLGWSAAGGLLFQVTGALEEQGREVSDIILMDSFPPRGVTGAVTEGEEADNGERDMKLVKWAEQRLEALGLEFMKDRVKEKIKAYRAYNQNLRRLPVVNADVHLILSEETLEFSESIKSGTWRNFTAKSFTVYEGCGKHQEMFDPGPLKTHINLINRIFQARGFACNLNCDRV